MSAKVHVGADDQIAAVKPQPPELPKADDTTCSSNNNNQGEVEFAKCDCCGLTEECTPAYIARIRGRYDGRWICGLCSEAVGEEILRSDGPITTAEALDRHMSFSRSFRPPSSTRPPPDPKEHLISAMRQLLRRSLDSPRATGSTPSSPRRGRREDGAGDGGRGLGRSGSCFSSIGG